MPMYLFVATFTYYCFSCQMLTGRVYFTNDLYNFTICLMITMASYNFWKNYADNRIIQTIAVLMLISGVFIAVDLYIGYLMGTDVTDKTYAYGDKNSAGQILLCCAFFILYFFAPNSRKMYFGGTLVAIFLLVIMVMLRSRATLVSAFYLLYYFTIRKSSKKIKIWTIILFVISIAFIFLNSDIYNTIINGIILGGRDATDVNSLSSNRVILFAIALQLIPQHPWVGSGDYYVDCLPLNLLTEFGIIGLLMFTTLIVYIYIYLKRRKKCDKLSTAAYAIYISFLLNGLFEAYPPFGPGVKCFTLWMLLGFTMAISQKIKNDVHIAQN